MEDLIKAHQQAKQKQAQANAYLSDLDAREKETKRKLAEIATSMRDAEAQVANALTSESLEQALTAVEEAQQNERAANTLLKNIERAIKDTKTKLPALHNDVLLVEVDVWAAERERLIQEIKAHTDVLALIMKAYVAAWQTGYGWDVEVFIREKILGSEPHIDPEVLFQLKNEMAKQIFPDTDDKLLNPTAQISRNILMTG